MERRGAPLLGLAGCVLLGLTACAESGEGPTGPPTEVAREVFQAYKARDFDRLDALHLTPSEVQELMPDIADAEAVHQDARAMREDRFRRDLAFDAVDWETAEIVDSGFETVAERGEHAVLASLQIKSAAGIALMHVNIGWFNQRWIVGMVSLRLPMLLGFRVELGDPGEAWEALDLADGDVIVAVDGKWFESWESMNELWADAMRRKEASLTIERERGQHRQLRVDMAALARALAAGGAALEPRAIE